MTLRPDDIETVVTEVHLPAGVAGPDPVDFDVRSYLVAHPDGVVLINTGMAGTSTEIGSALARMGAQWTDVTDVVLTHRHADHIEGLSELDANGVRPDVWAGTLDAPAIPHSGTIRPLRDGGAVRNLRVVTTPGHTPGHCSFLLEGGMILFAGDTIGSTAGVLTRGPAAFTADQAQAEESLGRILAIGPRRMLFGHGPELDDPSDALRGLIEDGPPPPGSR